MTVTAPETFTLEVFTQPIAFAAATGPDQTQRTGSKREFTALAVPYGVEIDRRVWETNTRKMRFEPGSVSFRDTSKIFYNHDTFGTPIGRVLSATEAEDGPQVRARLSTTPKADEVYTLMQPDEDGVAVLDRVSMGLFITSYAVEGADTDTPVLVVMSADVYELSVVPYPAYEQAAVTEVLSSPTRPKGTTMPNPTQSGTVVLDRQPQNYEAEVAELRGELAQMQAILSTWRADAAAAKPKPLGAEFASYGHYVKALAGGDQAAATFAQTVQEQLAYAGGTSDDTIYGETWVGDIIRLIERARKVWNLFDSGPLPAEGTKLEYGKIASNTVQVGQQIAEGEAILMGNISVDTAFADVLTFAGGSELTLQQVKRSNVGVLDLHWRALAIAYSKVMETYARTTVNGVAAKELGSKAAIADGISGWIDFLVDGAMHLDDKGLNPEFLRLSVDQFKALAKLREGVDGPFLLNRDTGRINLLDQTGGVAGLPIVVMPGNNGLIELGNSFALKTFESPGAPARLGPQEDITTLTEGIGVYGFGAIAVQDAEALVRPGA